MIRHPFIIIFENRLTDYIHRSSTAAFSSSLTAVFSYLLTFISKKTAFLQAMPFDGMKTMWYYIFVYAFLCVDDIHTYIIYNEGSYAGNIEVDASQ